MPDTVTTVSTQAPWGPQQKYLEEIFAEAEKNYKGPNPAYFPGQVTAALDPATKAAQDLMLSNATNAQTQADQAAATSKWMMTDAMDVSKNPYLQAAIQAAINPMMQNFYGAGGQMQQLRGGAGDAGQYGGSRQGIAEGIATRGLTQKIGDTSSQMSYQGYQSGLDAAKHALSLAPQTMKMQVAAPTMMDAVGTQRQAYEQKLIDDQIAKWNWEQNLPAEKLAVYRNTITGNYGGTGTATAPAGSSNPYLSAAGGALTGYSVGNMVGYPGVGAILGAAGGYFGA